MQQQDTALKYPTCGYNLTALTSATCPKCGEPFVLARRNEPATPPAELTWGAGVSDAFLWFLGLGGNLDRRYSIWPVAAGMLMVTAVLLLFVWLVSR